MAKKLDTTYKSARFGNCTYALILDKRHPKKDKNTFPVVMRYTIDRKSWYNFVAGEFTEEDFAKVCNLSVKAVRSELYDKKLEFDAIFEAQVELIERLGNSLTLDKIKAPLRVLTSPRKPPSLACGKIGLISFGLTTTESNTPLPSHTSAP